MRSAFFGYSAVIIAAVCVTVGQPVGTMLSDTGGCTGSKLLRLSLEHAVTRIALASTAAHPAIKFRNISHSSQPRGFPAYFTSRMSICCVHIQHLFDNSLL